MTAAQYPSYGVTSSPTTGPNPTWTRDTMGRLNTMTDATSGTNIVSATSYGPSNELLKITGNGGLQIENRTYNAMLQVTSLTAYSPSGGINYTYNYVTGQNNGKLESQTDNVSGEQVVYTYDALNRLASATATSGSWGQSYSYDGFGNLTAQNVTAGSAPTYSAIPDPTTNHVGSVDANGNTLGTVDPEQESRITSVDYDVENRYTGTALSGGIVPGNYQYSYAPGNKRVWRGDFGNNTNGGTGLTTDEVTFWSVSGQKMASYNIVMTLTSQGAPQSMFFNLNVANYYFGGKLVGHYNGGYVGVSNDRLGSIGKYYPYGQEKPSATTNGTEKFTGYFRDSETGFDYADQRYHNPGTGRFLTPDPYPYSASITNPGTWNKYAYTHFDPINHTDRNGLSDSCTDGDCDESSDPGDDGGGDDGGDGGGGGSGDCWWDDANQVLQCSTTGICGEGCSDSGSGNEDCTSNPYQAVCSGLGTTDQGGAPASPRQRQTDVIWLGTGLKSLKTFSNPSQPCASDLKALGLTVSSVDSIAASIHLVNLFSLPTGNPGQGNFDSNADLTAAQGPGGNFVVYNSNNFWQTTYSQILGSLLHEIAHLNNMSLSDTQLQSALSLTPNATDTTNISNKLATDCFPNAKP